MWGEARYGPDLLAIGVYEFLVFRRFGYIPMSWFRLAYYSVWHVIWSTQDSKSCYMHCRSQSFFYVEVRKVRSRSPTTTGLSSGAK